MGTRQALALEMVVSLLGRDGNTGHLVLSPRGRDQLSSLISETVLLPREEARMELDLLLKLTITLRDDHDSEDTGEQILAAICASQSALQILEEAREHSRHHSERLKTFTLGILTPKRAAHVEMTPPPNTAKLSAFLEVGQVAVDRHRAIGPWKSKPS